MQVLCTDAYGSMLWDLGSYKAQKYFRSWNTWVKLAHDLPRSTFTYLVEGFLSDGHPSFRYHRFYRSLLSSPSREILARIVSEDPRSTTCTNLKYLKKMTNLNQPQFYSAVSVKRWLFLSSKSPKKNNGDLVSWPAWWRSRVKITWGPGLTAFWITEVRFENYTWFCHLPQL